MSLPGIRNHRLPNSVTSVSRGSHGLQRTSDYEYEREGEPDDRRGGRTAGAGERGVHQLPQQLSSTLRTPAFHEGSANCSAGTGQNRRLPGHPEAGLTSRLAAVLLVLALSLLTACGGHKQVKAGVPPPPITSQPETTARSGDAEAVDNAGSKSSPDKVAPSADKILFTEIGTASWYGPPYHNRRGSNGEVYDMNAMTAAHRTLPLGSIVRVTNVKTGHSATVRITDRGPFIPGRILDLSLAAAKRVDVQQAGLAQVRLEVLKTPAPLNSGGRWAVQIGAFDREATAGKMADHISRRYHTAKILHFASPTGDWWVRVRVQSDDRRRAEEIARTTQTSEGAVFLVRLD